MKFLVLSEPLAALILRSLRSHFFVNTNLHVEVAINITLSQS